MTSSFNPAPFAGGAGGGSGSGGAPDWTPNTPVEKDALYRSTVESGTIKIGDLIRANTTRTTGATFDATEAANWTEVSWDTPIIDNLSSNTTSWALSANQGRILDSKVTAVDGRVSTVNTDLQDYKTKSGLVLDWAASTAVRANEVRRATVAVGTILVGDLIRSNSAHTTGSVFNATEAALWTEISSQVVVDDALSTSQTTALTPNQGRILNDQITALETSAQAEALPVSRIRVRLSGNTVNNVAHLRDLRLIDDTGVKVQWADVVLTTGANSALPISTFIADLPFDDDQTTWWGMSNNTAMTNATDVMEAIYTLPAPRKIKSFTMSTFNGGPRTYHSGSMEAQFVGYNNGTLANGSDGTWYTIIATQPFVIDRANDNTEGTMTGYQPDIKTIVEDSLTSTSGVHALSANQGRILDSKVAERFSRNIKRVRIRLTNSSTDLGAHIRCLEMRKLDGTRITTSDFSIVSGAQSNAALTLTNYATAVNTQLISGTSTSFWNLGSVTVGGTFQEAVLTFTNSLPILSIGIGTYHGDKRRYYGLQLDVEFADEAGPNDNGANGNWTNVLPMQPSVSVVALDNTRSTHVIGNLFKEYYNAKKNQILEKNQNAVIIGAGNRVFNGAAETNDTTAWYNISIFPASEGFEDILTVVNDPDFSNGRAFNMPVTSTDYRYTHKAVACSPASWHTFEIEYKSSGATTDGFLIRVLEMPFEPAAGYINVTNSSSTAQTIYTFFQDSPLTPGMKRLRGRFKTLTDTQFCSIEIDKSKTARNVSLNFGSLKIKPIEDIRYSDNMIINSGAGFSRTHLGSLVGADSSLDTTGWFLVQGTTDLPTFTSVSDFINSKRGAAYFKLGKGSTPTAISAYGYHRLSIKKPTGYEVSQVYYISFWARATANIAAGFSFGSYESDGAMTGDYVNSTNKTAEVILVNDVGLTTEWTLFEMLYYPTLGMLHSTPYFRQGLGVGTADIYLDDIQFREVTG